MSLKHSLAKAVFAAPLVFAMAANANAEEPAKFVQLSDLSATQPIPANVCVRDDAQGTAFQKITAIKTARGQVNVVEANRAKAADANGNGAYAGIAFTSNLKASETKGLTGEGYAIISNAPKGQIGTQYCITIANNFTGMTSAITGTKVPNNVNKGEMGKGLTNSMNRADSKVGYIGITAQGTLLAVNFNYNTKQGGYILADGAGNNPLPIPLVDVEYSLELPLAHQKALGIPVERMASADPTLARR